MIKKIFLHFWTLRHQFIKYFLIGSSGFILDILTLVALKEILGLNPVIAVVINQFFMINYIFFLNKHWTFKARGITKDQMVRFWVLMLWNYTFAILIMWIGSVLLEINYIYVRILSIAVVVSWNFILYKYWVFMETKVCIKELISHLKYFLKPKNG